jgi:hypothetical protein
MEARGIQHVVILVHRNDAFERAGYILNEVAAVWRDTGVQVSVLNGPGGRMNVDLRADLAILHVDLTVVPADYLAILEQYPLVINGRVRDTSKRAISGQRVRQGDGYEGPVIVKTNRNFGGTMEARLAAEGPILSRFALRLRNRLPWSWRSSLPVAEYPVFESPTQVPQVAWHNPDLIVERFLPEYHDGHYCLRNWTFLGDKEIITMAYSAKPIVKSRNIIHREPLTEVPDDLRQLRRDLGFDFGKFDYSIVDGKAVLFDANRTPSLGSLPRKEFLAHAQLLAEGIKAFQ